MQIVSKLAPTSILIVHLGGNDLGRMRTLDLLLIMKIDLYRFRLTSPNTTVIFSEIVFTLVLDLLSVIRGHGENEEEDK